MHALKFCTIQIQNKNIPKQSRQTGRQQYIYCVIVRKSAAPLIEKPVGDWLSGELRPDAEERALWSCGLLGNSAYEYG